MLNICLFSHLNEHTNTAQVLRRLLKKYREAKKIDKHQYHRFYLRAKGNVYKNKRVLIEFIHKDKLEYSKKKALAEQQEARTAFFSILAT